MLYMCVHLSLLLVLAFLGDLALWWPTIKDFLSCGRELGMRAKTTFVAQSYWYLGSYLTLQHSHFILTDGTFSTLFLILSTALPGRYSCFQLSGAGEWVQDLSNSFRKTALLLSSKPKIKTQSSDWLLSQLSCPTTLGVLRCKSGLG